MKNSYKEKLLKYLDTTEDGLTEKEALRKLSENGVNALPHKKKDSLFKIFISEFKDPIVIVLIIASFISFVSDSIVDGLAIIFIILVDAIIGTLEENKASTTAEALSNLVKDKEVVMRSGQRQEILSENIVVGDLVLISSGEKVSADMIIVESHNLTVNESILTGESEQIEKAASYILDEKGSISDKNNILYAGSTIVTGRAKAFVFATGLDTQMGKIADSINSTKEEKSPLNIRVEKFSKQISILIIVIAILIAILLFFKGYSKGEIFLNVVALAVSAMPEGLPLALSMALTIASNKMAKKNVVVRKLKSVESLGSCTVIASDKTGTLTVNEQTAKKIILPNNYVYEVTGNGYKTDGAVRGPDLKMAYDLATLGVINNEAIFDEENISGDSIDIAFLVLGKKMGVNTSDIEILEMIPYESENKYSAVFYKKENKYYVTIKGSLEKVKSFCKKDDYANIDKQNENLAKDGYRVIALASSQIKAKDTYIEKDIKNLVFNGLVGFIDPIREEVKPAVDMCKQAGIKVLMITGDHPLTAYTIAKDVGITKFKDEVTTYDEVEKYLQKGSKAFDKFVASKKVFTRVTPLQKLEIVNSLKRMGEFVAVTGDGVNDAPALKSANIGISMGSGSDISLETAKMIVTDDNFTSIVTGIKEGRCAYSNIRKIIFFLISCGLAEVLFFVLAIMFDMPVPLVAIQLLWLNIVTDGVQDLALSFEKPEEGIMDEPPRNPKEPLFDKALFSKILFSGVLIGLVVFITWYILIKIIKMDLSLARGYIMAMMVFIQNIHVFNCRSEKKFAFEIPFKTNILIFFGVFIAILMQVIIMENNFLAHIFATSSVPFFHMLILFVVSLIVLVAMEIYKFIAKELRK